MTGERNCCINGNEVSSKGGEVEGLLILSPGVTKRRSMLTHQTGYSIHTRLRSRIVYKTCHCFFVGPRAVMERVKDFHPSRFANKNTVTFVSL